MNRDEWRDEWDEITAERADQITDFLLTRGMTILENTRYRPDGRRRCAECYRIRDVAYKATHRDLINARRRQRRSSGKAI